MSLPAVPTTNSKAQIALGSILSIGPAVGTPSPTYTPILEVISAKASGFTRNVVKFSELNNLYTQKRAGVLDPGTFDLTVARVATDAGQEALKAAAIDATGQPYLFEVQFYPNTENGQTTAGDTAQFAAIVSKYNELGDLTPEGLIQTEVTLELTGAMTINAGS